MNMQFVARRVGDDVSRLYVDARVAGLNVGHLKKRTCKTFDSTPPGTPGVYRTIGDLTFLKDARRWKVRAASDANAIELATLISFGLRVIRDHGTQPGHWTRDRRFYHQTWPDGRRVAAAWVCYQLTTDDLLGASASATDVEELMAALLSSDELTDIGR